MMKVYIVHGYSASPDSHWFPWLEAQLVEQGIACERVAMPNSANPTPDAWLQQLAQRVTIDDQTVVIGHSLGCIALMNFLARNYEKPKGAIFVSGFYQPLNTLPELTPFSNVYAVSPPLLAFPSYVVTAEDDEIVPPSYSDALASHLQATYLRLPKGGHFLDREGWTQFPLLLTLLSALFERPLSR